MDESTIMRLEFRLIAAKRAFALQQKLRESSLRLTLECMSAFSVSDNVVASEVSSPGWQAFRDAMIAEVARLEKIAKEE